MQKTEHPVIFTTIHRLDWEQVAPFFLSLRKTGYKGSIVVFASRISEATSEALRSCGVEVIPFFFPWRHVRNRIGMCWFLWRNIFRLPLPIWIKQKIAHIVFHLFFRRHLLYQDYLKSNIGRFSHVLACDCRDVYFQADPFEWDQNRGVHFFLEDSTTRIGGNSHHRRWVTALFGKEVLDRLSPEIVSCAGTIYGDSESILEYFDAMVRVSMKANSLKEFDGDQGVHNYLLYYGMLPNVTVHQNDTGPVATLGAGKPLISYKNGKMAVLNLDGAIVPVLHQYDRDIDLKEHLLVQLKHSELSIRPSYCKA